MSIDNEIVIASPIANTDRIGNKSGAFSDNNGSRADSLLVKNKSL